jgi:hypothetical protein
MGMMQDIFESEIKEQLSLHKIGTKLIRKKFGELGITLTDTQIAAIESKLCAYQGGTFTVSIDDDQLPVLNPKFGETIKNTLHFDLKESKEEIDKIIARFTNNLPKTIVEIAEGISEPILNKLKRDAPTMLRSRRKEMGSFQMRLAKRWRKPLDLLEMFLVIALEAGENFNFEFRGKASKENDYVFEALVRLHARACQNASEVLALLKTGHADGAMARWRSLHEIAAVGFFIKENGKEVAERYLLHRAVESYKAAVQYQQYCKILGYKPFSIKEIKKITLNYQCLVNRFGPAYKGNYGWSASALHKHNPTFVDIEKGAKLAHLRPFYKMACQSVHATSQGIFFKLGLTDANQGILLAGPSNAGLADPGEGTAISLEQITTALLLTKPNIDALVICKIMAKLTHEIGEEFVLAQRALKNSESTK